MFASLLLLAAVNAGQFNRSVTPGFMRGEKGSVPIGFTLNQSEYTSSMARNSQLRLSNKLALTKTSCEADLRAKVTTCQQFCSEWWVVVVVVG